MFLHSVANPRCLSRIRIFSVPDPVSASKNLSVLTLKNCFQAFGNLIGVFSKLIEIVYAEEINIFIWAD
jgi:hypothetical protein